jgi:integrase/recombinase XerD
VDIASFRLHLAAENKAAGTIRICTDAACWFSASHLLTETDKTRWEQVDAWDVRRWMVWLLGRYSEAYAYQQYRSLQQFFRWLSVEEGVPSPMAKLRPPKVVGKPVPFFCSVELSKVGRCCRGTRSRTDVTRRS